MLSRAPSLLPRDPSQPLLALYLLALAIAPLQLY